MTKGFTPTIYVNGKRIKPSVFSLDVTAQWGDFTVPSAALKAPQYRLVFPDYVMPLKEIRVAAERNKMEIHGEL